jgi:hypothetical protein
VRTASLLPLRWLILVGVAIDLALISYPLSAYPDLRVQPALLTIVAPIALLMVYAVLVWLGLRGNDPANATVSRLAIFFGLLVGAMWAGEILAGNLGDTALLGQLRTVNNPLYLTIGRSFIGLAVALSVVAGLAAAWRTGRLRVGLFVGLWSGLISGLVTVLVALTMTYVFIEPLQTASSNLQEFHASGATNMAVFLVQDIIGASAAHLLIGLGLGLVAGTVGGVIGAALSLLGKPRRRSVVQP